MALRHDPSNIKAFYRLGTAHSFSGDLEDAIQDF